jgi:hypothetical protein
MNPKRRNMRMLRTFRLVGTKTPEKVVNFSEASDVRYLSPLLPFWSTLASRSGPASSAVLGSAASFSDFFHQLEKYPVNFECEERYRMAISELGGFMDPYV